MRSDKYLAQVDLNPGGHFGCQRLASVLLINSIVLGVLLIMLPVNLKRTLKGKK